MNQPNPNPYEMNLLLLFKQLSLALDVRMADALREVSLHTEDMLLLAFLSQDRAFGPQDLAWLVGRSRQSVHRSLERLKRLGYVTASPSDFVDRNVFWGLTQLGHETWGSIQRTIAAEENRLSWNPESTRALSTLLREFIVKLLPFNPDAKSGLEPWIRRVQLHDQ
ncbi:MAG: MarR family transcriptional regulator [Myxococcaceae bacterium]